MKNIIISIFFLFISGILFAQDLKLVQIPRGARAENTVVIDGITTHSYSSHSNIPVNGTPFLNDHFQPGILELKDGKTSDEVPLRYNVAKDLFEILYNNDTLVLNRPFDVKIIKLDNKRFFYDLYFMEGDEGKRNGYFEVVREGALSLYIKRAKDLSYDSFVSTYKGGGGTKEYYYVDKISYFGRSLEGKPFQIKSAKSFLNALENHKPEMKAYIKSNKVKFKKEDDLIQLVDYYNTL